MRERLIELLNKKYDHFCDQCGVNKDSHYVDNLAEYLIDNGVVVPPCKVGDVVYRIYTRAWIGEDVVREVVVSENGVFYIDDKGRMTSCNKFGKTVFLTREEAEAKLKGE